MRRLILLAAVVACGLLAGPAGAQDADPCDVNPDAPECNVPPIAIQPAPSCPGGGFVLVVFGEALAPVCFPPPAPAAPVAPAAPTTVIQQTIVQQVVAAPIIPAVQPAGCGDSRRNFTVRLPGRFHTYTRVRVMFGGIVQHGDGQNTVAVGQDRRINVDMRGFKCGVYALIVRQGHKAPVVRIYTAGPHGNLTNLNVALAQARRAR